MQNFRIPADAKPLDSHPVAQAVLARFPGAIVLPALTTEEIAARDAENARRAAEAIRQEAYAAGGSGYPVLTFGPDVLANGWSFFPQIAIGTQRRPALAFGRAIKWKAFATTILDRSDLDHWIEGGAGNANVAAIMGRASGDAFAVDIDIGDEDFCRQVQDLAFEILGPTPFRRVGRAPRIALIYRQAPEEEQSSRERIPSRSHRFVAEDGGKGDDGLEILSRGKPITLYGYHHRTGQPFRWVGEAEPATHSPEHAPLVTQRQVEAFKAAVQEIRPFHRQAASTAGEGFSVDTRRTYDSSADLTPPPGLKRTDATHGTGENSGEVEWTKIDGAWRVTRHRDAFLLRRSYRWITSYKELALSDEGLDLILQAALAEALEWIERSGDWHSDDTIRREVEEKIRRTAGRLRDGDLTIPSTFEDPEGRRHTVRSTTVQVTKPSDPFGFILSHIKPAAKRKPIPGIVDKGTPDPILAHERRIRTEEERKVIREKVARRVRRRIKTWLYRVWHYVKAEKTDKMIALLKAPPGAGKSTTLISLIAEVVEEKGPLGKPIGIMMPSHTNLSEMLERALRPEVGGVNAWDVTPEDLVVLGNERGIVVHIYKGRIAAGCHRPEEMKLLEQAGIRGGGLCIDENVPDGEEPVTCVFYEQCRAIQQRKKILSSDVVLMATAYLTAQPPEELSKGLAALVIDESCWGNLVHTTADDPLPLSVLRADRNPPELTPKQIGAGMNGEELAVERGYLATYLANAIERGEHPDQAVKSFPLIPQGKSVMTFVDAALEVTKSSWNRSKGIKPNLTLEGVRHITKWGRIEYLSHEWRFWHIIKDRLLRETHDAETAAEREKILQEVRDEKRTQSSADAYLIKHGIEQRAFGSHDYRLQRVRKTEGQTSRTCIRTSWRTKPNFAKLPILMLDASAAPEIIAKCWPGRTVRTYTVGAPLHIRTVAMLDKTMSDRSMTLGGRRGEKVEAEVAQQVVLNRDLVSTVCSLYDWGLVLAGMPKKGRPIFQCAWDMPKNLSIGHFGAMRGLNIFERYVAAVSLGRMEPPVSGIDGLVAALTFDDPVPEEPVDTHGNGQTAWRGGEDLPRQEGVRTVKLRNGANLQITDAIYHGRWARLVQQQAREEELLQFVGRLRGVFRTGEPPVWFVAARCIPDCIIVDEVCAASDVARPSNPITGRTMEIARRTGGLLDATAGAIAPDIHGGELYQAEKIAELDLDNPASRARLGKIRVDYTADGDPEWKTTWVAGWVKDPIRAVEEAMAKVDVLVDQIRVYEPETQRIEASRKQPDAVDLAVTGLPEGASIEDYDMVMEAQEVELRARVMDQVIHEFGGEQPNTWGGLGLPGVPRKDLRVSLDERMVWTMFRDAAAADSEAEAA